MGFTMLVLLACVGVIAATPMTDVRPLLDEFEMSSSNLAESAYRLRDTVQPVHIRVDLDVYLAESKFNGVVELDIEVQESGLQELVLHQKVVSIFGVTIVDAEDKPVPLKFPDPFTLDIEYELIKLDLVNPIPAGNYTLTITYEGKINENPLDRGFYKGYYFVGTQRVEYATTQFQPFHARKAFPCFDEPQFKATYVISIVRDKSLSPSYSNMDIADTQNVSTTRVREIFHRTPIISAYLIAFHVSDFVESKATSTAAQPFRIISRRGVESQHEYAAKVGLEITKKLSEFLDFNYYEMGQGVQMKNDHIALPDFPSGAMENWGMVNYREAYLLNDPLNTNLPSKTTIATIMAHELGHKWFGNLVTCFWWSNLWLNESFASFFEYFAAHWADNTLELDDQFIVDYLHSALSADAGAGATPMNWTTVADQSSISAHFSTTSYAKGASVLKMMEHFVGADTFRDALRRYLKANAYGLGTPAGMYEAFKEAVAATYFATDYPNIDVGEVFDSWVQTPGSPVVQVDVDMSTGVLTISQKRYQISGNPHTLLWKIPLSWTNSEELNFNTKPKFVLTTQRTTQNTSPGHRAVFFNSAQSGLYRVNYDDHNWQMIASFLRQNRESVHKMNRAQIVNDVTLFIRSKDISVDVAFDVLSFLKDETDYYVWAGALSQLDWIRRRFEHVPAAYKEFSDYYLSLLEAVINKLGYEELSTDSVSTKMNRMMILNYACVNLRHEGCIADSLAKWKAFKVESKLVNPNYRRYVYCVGLREGDASDYTFLYSRYNSSENTADMVVMLRALPCTRDEASIKHYLEQSMYNTKVRVHDKTNAFAYALQGNKENVPIAAKFLSDNFQNIEKWYGGRDRLGTVISSFSSYLTDFKDIVEFQTFVYKNQIALGSNFNTGVYVVTTAVNNLGWGNEMALDVVTKLRSYNSATAIVTPFFILIAAFVVHLMN